VELLFLFYIILFYWFDKADIAVLVDIKVAAGAVWAVTRAVGAAAVIAGAAANAAGATSTVAIEGISSSVFFWILFSALSESI
jgi:hypothetical protein